MHRLVYIISFFLVATLMMPGCKEHDYNPSWTYYKGLGKDIANHYNQRFLASGTAIGIFSKAEKTIWGYSVMETRDITLSEARTLAAKMLKSTLDPVLTNPLFIDYFKDRAALDRNHPSEIAPKYFGFKVTFWDKNMDRPSPSYIAQIEAVDGWVSFYYADPKTQSLQEPPAEKIRYEELLSWAGLK